MSKLRCGVIGVGYLGAFHAEKYRSIADAELIGIYDNHFERAHEVSDLLGVTAFCSLEKMLEQVDAVSIVTPTVTHYELAKKCLNQGVHALLEKPMTQTLSQAEELIQLANSKGLVLQVGHIEHFNPVFRSGRFYLHEPKHFEARRLMPFQKRGTDVNVILELMIHDIGLIQSLVQSPVKSLKVEGQIVKTSFIDKANVWIEFENHCTAELIASRVHFEVERTLKAQQEDSDVLLDFHQKLLMIQPKLQNGQPINPHIQRREFAFNNIDTLKDEIQSFLHSIMENKKPVVTGTMGYSALALALEISQQLEELQELEIIW